MVDFLDINGARLAYRIVGEGPLFITLHGGRGMGEYHHACLVPLLSALAR